MLLRRPTSRRRQPPKQHQQDDALLHHLTGRDPWGDGSTCVLGCQALFALLEGLSGFMLRSFHEQRTSHRTVERDDAPPQSKRCCSVEDAEDARRSRCRAPRLRLRKGTDARKDQSYVLFTLTQCRPSAEMGHLRG